MGAFAYCTSCGERSSGSGRFCAECGNALLTADIPPPPSVDSDEREPGPGLLDPAIEFKAVRRSQNGGSKAGNLTLSSDGLHFAVGSRDAARDPYGLMGLTWQWADIAQLDFSDAAPSHLRFFGGGERAAHLTVTPRGGAAATLEIAYDVFVVVEEAAFCVAAATDVLVTLDGFEVTGEEAADELEHMLDDEGTVPPSPTQAPATYLPGYPIGYPAMPAPTNGLAIASLVCAFVFTPLGLVFGLIAKSQIKRTGESGGGLATAGIVISIIFMALAIAFWVFLAVAINNANNV